ncbi:MAG: hypothetical protein D6813_05280 [Calditrichaeota bacterium]|nr:MAG: hypothetical protein D6813_05280 [Calditrichota bacterium]
MLCQICNTRTAEIKIAQVVNNKKIELNLCKKCAEEKGVDNPLSALPQLFGNLIMGLLGNEVLKETTKQENEVSCSNCGLTWEEFQNQGLFGCDTCYDTFKEELKVVLRRIHGSNQHIGNRPSRHRITMPEIDLERAQKELQEAIRSENFERAAELRDLIRSTQRQIEKKRKNLN